jgi:hypothetical protein
MKKPIFPRIMGLLLLYIVIFTGLVLLQFAKRTSFTYRNGNIVVSGFYNEDIEQPILSESEFLISGEAGVFFQGIEFILAPERGFIMKDDLGNETKFTLEKMTVFEESINFLLSDGSTVEFSANGIGGNQELQIFSSFNNAIESVEIPFKTPLSAKMDDEENLVIVNDNIMYGFDETSVDAERKVLILSGNNPNARYAAIPEAKSDTPMTYILAEAESGNAYNDALQRWLDQSYLTWSRLIQSSPSEELAAAYVTESIKRGNYRQAVSAIPQSFLNNPQRSFRSSAFLGRLDLGLRSISAYEREYQAEISRLIQEQSTNIFNDSHVIHNLSVRNMTNFINDETAFIRTIDPDSVNINAIPGILEGWKDWDSLGNAEENPFGHLLEQAFLLLSQHITKLDYNGDAVFVHQNSEIDILYNMNLGISLIDYGNASGNQDRTFTGRSIILSVLRLVDQTGTIPLHIRIAEDRSIQIPAENRENSFRLYSLFHHNEYYPRAVPIKSVPGIWTWTSASTITSVMENNVLDISVEFPVGETHYMIIRGVRPFTKIQIYNMDFRTDPQFERYDSSGWSYSSSEQTLLVKMKHRTNIEHIRIFY